MTEAVLIRTIINEARRAWRVMQALQSADDSITRFAVKLEDLPLLRAHDFIYPLVHELALGSQIEQAVQKVEQASEDLRDTGPSARETGWREWLRAHSTDARPSISMTQPATSKTSRGAEPDTATAGARSPISGETKTSLDLFNEFSTALRLYVKESPVRPAAPSQVPRVISPASPQPAHVVAQRLLHVVERAEKACERRLEIQARAPRTASPAETVSRENEFSPPRTVERQASVIGSPRFDRPAQAVSGLRRLAGLASTERLFSVVTTPSTSLPDDSLDRQQREFPDEEFAARLAETLRAEAERSGVDPEGRIR